MYVCGFEVIKNIKINITSNVFLFLTIYFTGLFVLDIFFFDNKLV